MTTLVIDTATAACSVALIDGEHIVARRHDVVGRGHAERLVPMIADLPGGGRADRILVDCGPGSFTGVRVGIAAARGLALGWDVPVAGYSSTTLLAAAALAEGAGAVAVALEGGHGELFVQCFDAGVVARAPLASLVPGDAARTIGSLPVIGTGIARLAGLIADGQGREAFPDAALATLLPHHLAALPARPIYGRAPDAKLPGTAA